MTQKFIVICILLFLMLSGAQAATIPLSTHSSGASVDAALLDADLDISIGLTQSKPDKNQKKWLLTLTAANLTPDFSINEIYFNTTANPDDIKKFQLKNLVGGGNKNDWVLTYSTDNINVGGFGLFDISLESTSEQIDPQETFTFEIEIQTTFAPDYTFEDFFVLSSPQSEALPAYGAAKFFDGPEGQIAHGAYVQPEPATVFLLSLGALALLRRRKG